MKVKAVVSITDVDELDKLTPGDYFIADTLMGSSGADTDVVFRPKRYGFSEIEILEILDEG